MAILKNTRSKLQSFLWVSLVLPLILSSVEVIGDESSSGFDFSAFRALPVAERINVILTVLDARDAALQNIEYTVLETYVNVNKKDGTRRYMYKSLNQLRRRDQKLWLHVQEFESHKPDGKLHEDSVQNWDGKIGRRLTLPPYTGEPEAIGQINPKVFNSFIYHRFLAITGLRLKVIDEQFPMTRWLRDVLQEGAKLDATDSVRRGVNCLKLTVDRLGWRRELWLDPARGFMPVQFDQVYGDKTMEWLMEVLEADQHAGVWFPRIASGINTGTSDKEIGESKFEVQNFKVGAVRETDLEVVFPIGTSVVDSVRNIGYTMLPDGKFKLTALAVPEAAVVFEPPVNNIVDHVDAGTVKTFIKTPLLPYVPPPPLNRSRGVLRAVFYGVNALLVLIALWWNSRRVRRVAKAK